MKKTSRIAKKLRTSIGDLTGVGSVSDEQLAQVAGARPALSAALGGIGQCTVNKCWQKSASVTNPGEPDNAQDYVID